MYRHGLRVSEAVGLRRDQVNLAQARVWVARLKNSLSVEQPIAGDELRAITAPASGVLSTKPIEATVRVVALLLLRKQRHETSMFGQR